MTQYEKPTDERHDVQGKTVKDKMISVNDKKDILSIGGYGPYLSFMLRLLNYVCRSYLS